MRVKVFVDYCRPKVHKLPDQKPGNEQPETPLESTPPGGRSPGKLQAKAKLVNLRSLDVS